MEIKGKYGIAKVMTENIEQTAQEQLKTLLDQPYMNGNDIRIMPDVHAGKGATIGTSIKLNNDYICPSITGIDLGCGMHVFKLDIDHVDFEKLDQLINNEVPSGFNVYETPIRKFRKINDTRITHLKNYDHILNSIGTLGGGNHFIEIDQDTDGVYYMVIHSGSRNLGVQVANYYQRLAISNQSKNVELRDALIAACKEVGQERQIEGLLNTLKQTNPIIPDELAPVSGQDAEDYLYDVSIAQEFAALNRLTMAETIIYGMNWQVDSDFDSIHNYIDIDNRIIRKGATDASLGKQLVIPLNMRDGSIIATGLGNSDWNYSAPHGAGRVMSRKKAFETVDMDDFTKSMEGIYSTSVVKETIDESPFAYKPAQEIIDAISEKTVHIDKVIKPVYNYKAH